MTAANLVTTQTDTIRNVIMQTDTDTHDPHQNLVHLELNMWSYVALCHCGASVKLCAYGF